MTVSSGPCVPLDASCLILRSGCTVDAFMMCLICTSVSSASASGLSPTSSSHSIAAGRWFRWRRSALRALASGKPISTSCSTARASGSGRVIPRLRPLACATLCWSPPTCAESTPSETFLPCRSFSTGSVEVWGATTEPARAISLSILFEYDIPLQNSSGELLGNGLSCFMALRFTTAITCPSRTPKALRFLFLSSPCSVSSLPA